MMREAFTAEAPLGRIGYPNRQAMRMNASETRALPADIDPTVAHVGDRYAFEEFLLWPSSRVLTRDDVPVPLGARALDILIVLVERAGQVVSKAELFALVWPDRFIEESNLRVHIAAVRKALGDDGSGTRPDRWCHRSRLQFCRGGQPHPCPGLRASSARNTDRATRPRDPARRAYPHLWPRRGRCRNRRSAEAPASGNDYRRRGQSAKPPSPSRPPGKLATSYRDGVQIIDLAPLAHPTLVAAHLASLLRLPALDREPLQKILAHLQPRAQLIVLDNCEHVIDTASEIAEAILARAPEIHLLATSREPLRAAGEWVQRLAPLAVPPAPSSLNAAEALRFAAIRLFVERWQAHDGSFALTDSDARVVADICTRLDGLPLAIELAVTRVPLFGLRGLADRLDDRFAILTKGRRTARPPASDVGRDDRLELRRSERQPKKQSGAASVYFAAPLRSRRPTRSSVTGQPTISAWSTFLTISSKNPLSLQIRAAGRRVIACSNRCGSMRSPSSWKIRKPNKCGAATRNIGTSVPSARGTIGSRYPTPIG
ncbi:MAG: winged helix-turn-helix domain-containing protein [Rhodospirillales bacterium]